MQIINNILPHNCFKSGRKKDIKLLVIHYISAINIDKLDPFNLNNIIKIFQDYKVSSHYMIDRKGIIYKLVEEHNTAYHAGVSIFEEEKNCNDYSIGIELIGGKDWQFTEEQYLSLIELTNNIRSRIKLSISNIVGHSQIAPGRKEDPGPTFNWVKYFNGLKNETINTEIRSEDNNKFIWNNKNNIEDKKETKQEKKLNILQRLLSFIFNR